MKLGSTPALAAQQNENHGIDDQRRFRFELYAGAAFAVLAIVASVWFIGFGRHDIDDVESELGVDLAVPESSLTEFVGDPGNGGEATEVVVSDAIPADAETFCDIAGSSNGSACRITASLVHPPSSPARSKKSTSSKSAGPLGPVGMQRPNSLGHYALHDAADPTVLVDGQTYYIFSTSARFTRVPLAVVSAEDLVPNGASGFSIRSRIPKPFEAPQSDFGQDSNGSSSSIATSIPDSTPSVSVLPAATEPETTTDPAAVPRIEAMPERPPWARQDDIWAPTVARFGNEYVMFFAAKRPNPPDPANEECIGRAVSGHPAGPYVADPTPVTCGLRGVHGALDPSVFRDRQTGRAFLHVAFGGTSTPLWSIPLTGDAHPSGAAVPLLKMQQRWETWFLENPSMIFNGVDYTLAYSAGRWSQGTYSTGVARCRTPVGPCASSPAGPWLAAVGAVSGPGGLDFFTAIDGSLMAVHHGYEAGREAAFGARHTFIRRAHADADTVTFP